MSGLEDIWEDNFVVVIKIRLDFKFMDFRNGVWGCFCFKII